MCSVPMRPCADNADVDFSGLVHPGSLLICALRVGFNVLDEPKNTASFSVLV